MKKPAGYTRIIPLLSLFISGLAFTGCDNVVSQRDKPEQKERSGKLILQLTDESGTMQSVYDREGVDSARIQMRSNVHGEEFTVYSDDEGVATVPDLISDTYFLSINRELSPFEIQNAADLTGDRYSLTNQDYPSVEFRAGQTDTIEVPLSLLFEGAPIVFSELYASGPPGAGLYFFDRFVEVYNQTDSTLYLDGLVIARVYASSYLGLNFIDDPEFIHSNNVWKYPGNGTDYPIEPGEFIYSALDAIDHRPNASESLDLSNADFEFYKHDAPDIDNPDVTNMIMIYQDSGIDWLIGGQADALVLADTDTDNLKWRDERILIPYEDVIDGFEYLQDPSDLDRKKLNPKIDAGATGGISFYTGRSMERRLTTDADGTTRLQNTNNSSVDFRINEDPTPGYHHELPTQN